MGSLLDVRRFAPLVALLIAISACSPSESSSTVTDAVESVDSTPATVSVLATATEPTTTEPETTQLATTDPATSAATTSTTTVASTLAPLLTTETTSPKSPVDPERLAALEREVINLFRKRASRFSGGGNYAIGFALTHGNEVVGSFSLGSTADGNALVDTSPFRLASISKTITAATVMRLVDEGRLQLDGTLGDQWRGELTARDRRARRITVRQLLQHTSCIPDLRPLFFGSKVKDWRRSAEPALDTRLRCDPGGTYKYSNANYALLGVLVERTTGLDFEDAVQQLVLQPLGITTASLSTTVVSDRSSAKYYVSKNRRYMEALGPAGAWAMSPSDTARLLAALQPDSPTSVLTTATRRQMQTAGAPEGGRYNSRYSLGLERYGSMWGHTGTLQSVRTIAFMLPNGYSFAVLSAGEQVGKAEELIRVFGEAISKAKALPKH